MVGASSATNGIGDREYSESEFKQLAKLYEGTLTSINENEIVKGRVVHIGDSYVSIDIGFKSEGMVSVGEFPDLKQLKVGDEIEVFLESVEDKNAEGVEIPSFVIRTFAALPSTAGEMHLPNYIEEFLMSPAETASRPATEARCLDCFGELWRSALAKESPERIAVLEPACGSANDFRCLEAYGLARLVDYTGFDLCEKNVANARALFPNARFELGNVFEIAAEDQSFELCFVHDLLEHFSLAGLERAVAELCRVTRHRLCVHFFQMDEMPDHIVRPVGEYHLNTLSQVKTEALFAQHGFAVQPLHIGSYLRQRVDQIGLLLNIHEIFGDCL